MSSAELYFRHHTAPVAFTVKLSGWTDAEAAHRGAAYLAMYVRSQSRQAAQALHSALAHERDKPTEAASENYLAMIHEVRDREGRAKVEAFSDWLLRPRPSDGHAITLCAAGDACGSGD